MIKSVFIGLLVTIAIVSSAWFLLFQSIRLDEAQTIWVATKPVPTLLKLVGGDVHVPLYFLLIHYFIQIFGIEIVMVRLPSLIFFLFSLVGLYKLGKEEGSKNAALLAIALFSLSPFMLWYSFEARMYTQFVFFAIFSHLYFLRLLSSNGEKGKFGLFLSTFGGIYTHYFFLSILLCQSFYLVFFCILSNPVSIGIIRCLKQSFKLLRNFFFVIISAFLLLFPWLYYVFTLGQISQSEPLIKSPSAFNFFQTFAFFLFGYQSDVTQGLIVALWPMLVLFIFLVFTHRKKIEVRHFGYLEMVTFLPVVLFYILSFIKPVFLARYLIFTVPTLFLLIANMLLVLSNKLSRTLIVLFFILASAFLTYQNFSATTPVKEDYKGVTEVLNREVQPMDVVAVSSPFTVYPIEYYYRGNARIDTIPEWDRFREGGIPAFNDEKLFTQFQEYQHVYNRVFVILSYDQGYEGTVRNYLDTHFEMLAKEQFSEGLELRVYKMRYYD